MAGPSYLQQPHLAEDLVHELRCGLRPEPSPPGIARGSAKAIPVGTILQCPHLYKDTRARFFLNALKTCGSLPSGWPSKMDETTSCTLQADLESCSNHYRPHKQHHTLARRSMISSSMAANLSWDSAVASSGSPSTAAGTLPRAGPRTLLDTDARGPREPGVET